MLDKAVNMLRRNFLCSLCFMAHLVSGYCVFAQDASNIIKTYFTDGKISTQITKLSNEVDRGSAVAFDRTGKEIYRMEVRRFAGNANVEFNFHPNGAVYTAHYTSHPDGGIQWSDITQYFDDQGTLVRIEDNSSDDFGRPTLHIQSEEREMHQAPVKSPPQNQATPCAEVMQTKVFAVNICRRKIRLRKALSVASANEVSHSDWITRGDTVLISSVIDAGQFTDIKPRVQPEFFLGRKQAFAEYFWSEPIMKSKNERHYILYVFEK